MTIRDDRIDLVIAACGTDAGPDQRILWELGTRLSPSRYRLELWLARAESMDPFAEALESCEIPVRRLRASEGFGWGGLLDLWREARRARPMLLHLDRPLGPGRRFAATLIQAAREARLVVTERALEERPSSAARLVDRRVAARADAIITPCAAFANRCVRDLGVRRTQVRSLGDGVDFLDPDQETAAARSLRDRLGAGPICPLWLCPESLEPDRGHEILMTALGRLRDLGLPFVAVWCADGPLRGELESRARTLRLMDRVHFLGSRSSPEPWFAAADLVVAHPPPEGISSALLEAQVRGRPVVATATGNAPDLIEDGLTGRLVPPRDATELTAAIESLARHPDAARRLGAAAARRVYEEHSWARRVEALEAVFDEVLGFATFAPDSRASHARP